MRRKIGIVGAGNVGGATAQRIAERNCVEQVVKIELLAEERNALDRSAESVRELLRVMNLPAGTAIGKGERV